MANMVSVIWTVLEGEETDKFTRVYGSVDEMIGTVAAHLYGSYVAWQAEHRGGKTRIDLPPLVLRADNEAIGSPIIVIQIGDDFSSASVCYETLPVTQERIDDFVRSPGLPTQAPAPLGWTSSLMTMTGAR